MKNSAIGPDIGQYLTHNLVQANVLYYALNIMRIILPFLRAKEK